MPSETTNVFSCVLLLLGFLACGTSLETDGITLGVSTNDLVFKFGDNSSFSVVLSRPSNFTLKINFTYDNPDVLEPLDSSRIFTQNETSVEYIVKAKDAGKVTIMLHVDDDDNITLHQAFVRVSVLHSPVLDQVSSVIGWMYFVAWSISFYPQIISNFKRKSVVGFNFDFIGLNITGFLFYSIFNVAMYFFHTVQEEYLEKNPTSVIPVEVNDVVFALHATFATIVQIGQCLFYERGEQRISLVAQSLIAIFWSGGFVFLIVTLAQAIHSYPWLTFIYYFSYVKLGITLIKYTPQAYFNFRRKSTDGWSIGNILLDFTGGVLSLLQMFFIAYNFNDWQSLFGNFTKFGLGMFSILFDILFMIQHYCLYRPRPTDRLISES